MQYQINDIATQKAKPLKKKNFRGLGGIQTHDLWVT